MSLCYLCSGRHFWVFALVSFLVPLALPMEYIVIKCSLIKLGQHLQLLWSQSLGRKCQVKQSLLSRLAEWIKFSLNIQRGKWISFSWRALLPPLSFEIYFHHVYLQEKTDGQNIHRQASEWIALHRTLDIFWCSEHAWMRLWGKCFLNTHMHKRKF